MIRAKKTAQLRLSTSPTIRRLAEWERPPIGRPIIHKRYAKKRRMERRHVRNYLPKRPLLETLIPSIQNNYSIKAIDKWNGEEEGESVCVMNSLWTTEDGINYERVRSPEYEQKIIGE